MESDVSQLDDEGDEDNNSDNSNNNEYKQNNEEEPIFKAKLCSRLSRELGLHEIIYEEPIHWEPPTKHGLENCNVIIPSYYKFHKNPHKILQIDYYEIIKDDIRNLRPLNEYQLKYIKDLSHEYKNELFDIFNDCVKVFNDSMK